MNLITELKKLVSSERKITTEILQRLLHVEDSKLFAELGYSSLFEFCVKELGYSEGAAYRRVSAMRLLRRHKNCVEKIASGELTLSNAAKVETILRQAKKQKISVTKQQEGDLFNAALGSSAKLKEEAQNLGVSISKSEISPPAALQEKLQKLHSLLSHKFPHATKEELLHQVLDEALEKQKTTPGNLAAKCDPKKRTIPKKLRAAVLQRDENQCSYRCPTTQRRCESKHFLEIDHILPFSLGGKTKAENLRVLCRQHNQYLAAKVGLGREKSPMRESP